MTKRQAIKASCEHWKRMIKWVKKQPRKDYSSRSNMWHAIKENWRGGYCPLCKLYPNGCVDCPLAKKYGNCSSYDVNAWKSVAISFTWQEWLIAAKKMLKQLESL